MNDLTGEAADGRSATVAALIADYFDRLQSQAHRAGITIDPDSVAELTAHVTEQLARAEGSLADANRILDELGTPESLARGYAASSSDDTDNTDDTDGTDDTSRRVAPRTLAGSVFGVPYDLRPPTSERYAAAVWNPSSRRLLVPKALGLGWTVNLGAIAVLAHLVRPDDEDEPFGEVPPRMIAATLLAPAAVTAAFAVAAARSWPSLPAIVPTHWGVSGRPDGYSRRGTAVFLLAALAAAPLAGAARVHLSRRPSFNRVGASTASLALATVAVGILGQTVHTVRGGTGMWPTWAGIGTALSLPLLLLTTVSRVGRAGEQRRDLAVNSMNSMKGLTK